MTLYKSNLTRLHLTLTILLLFSNKINSTEWIKLKYNQHKIKKEQYKSEENSKRVKFIFAHSYHPDLSQENNLYKHYQVIPQNVECLPHQSSLGQKEDIKMISNALRSTNIPVVGVGLEFGANSWINAAADPHNLQKMHALVLDTPCADVNEIIYSATYFNYIPGGEFIIKKIAKLLLGYYDPNGIQPIDAIKDIANKELPIFIIHSKEDNVFSINQSRQLYLEFLTQKFTNVYLIEVPHGNHKDILNSLGYRLYQQTLHQFYKKFNIPYDVDLAHLSKNIKIKRYKPDADLIREKMELNFLDKYKTTIVKSVILLYIAYKCNQYFPNTSIKIQNCILFFLSLFKRSNYIKI